MNDKRKGMMIVLSSPSGAGKTTLCKKILENDKNISMSVSATTRPKRKSEIDSKDYFFYEEKKFFDHKRKGLFIETAEVFGYNYGTPKKFVEERLIKGRDIIFDIDWQGTQKLASYSKTDLVSIFILPPSTKDLESRLKKRAEDSVNTVRNRMSKAKAEISHWIEYDYVLVNDNLELCIKKIQNIISVERLKRHRQFSIFDFVNSLI
tara:strand:- start:54 stop:674 length:621 start_codon:yes stop_codon:yes gene_type:complete